MFKKMKKKITKEESNKLNESSSKNENSNTSILKVPNVKKSKNNFQKINKKTHELKISKTTEQKNPEVKKKRHYGIDIARILAIFFIINHHILFHGGPMNQTKLLSDDNNLLFISIQYFIQVLTCLE